MGQLIRFPPRRPSWLYLTSDRLMVACEQPIGALHAMARRVGLTRADFFRGQHHSGSLPYYRIQPAMLRIVAHVFGLPLPPQSAADAAARCFRRRGTGPERANCGQ